MTVNVPNDIFTNPEPCQLCEASGPTYPDQETSLRYCLACLEKAVDALNTELALTAESDVYDVILAFDKAQDVAPTDRTILRRLIKRFPQFADGLLAVGFARFALGWTLTEPLAEGPEDLEVIMLGREVIAGRLLPVDGGQA